MEGYFGRPKQAYIKKGLKQGERSWIIFVLAQGRSGVELSRTRF